MARETRPSAPAGIETLATTSATPPVHLDRQESEPLSVALAQEDGHGSEPWPSRRESGRLLPTWAYGRHFSRTGRSRHSASGYLAAWHGRSLTVASAHPMARRPQVCLLHNAAVQRLCCCSPSVSRGIGMGMHKLAGPLCPGGVDHGPEVGSRGLESADEGGASGSTWGSATRCYLRCPSITAVR
jgi:hypothetical protein